jgi:hypothetical protein
VLTYESVTGRRGYPKDKGRKMFRRSTSAKRGVRGWHVTAVQRTFECEDGHREVVEAPRKGHAPRCKRCWAPMTELTEEKKAA